MRRLFGEETGTATIMSAYGRHRGILVNQRSSYDVFYKVQNRPAFSEQNKHKPKIPFMRCAVKLSHERRFKVTRVNGVLMFIRMLGDGT